MAWVKLAGRAGVEVWNRIEGDASWEGIDAPCTGNHFNVQWRWGA